MYTNIDIDKFIKKFITRRDKSLLSNDLSKNNNKLTKKISNASVLVIGGAGTIGSSYIKALLKLELIELQA